METKIINAFTSSKNTECETPSKFFEMLNEKYEFAFDLAATDLNHKTPNYITNIFNPLLNTPWALNHFFGNVYGRAVYMNPPYGRDIGKFIARAIELSDICNFYLVMLLPARTDTRWFELILDRENDRLRDNFSITFLRGRLIFELNGKPILNPKTGKPSPALFPSMLVKYDARFNEKC